MTRPRFCQMFPSIFLKEKKKPPNADEKEKMLFQKRRDYSFSPLFEK